MSKYLYPSPLIGMPIIIELDGTEVHTTIIDGGCMHGDAQFEWMELANGIQFMTNDRGINWRIDN